MKQWRPWLAAAVAAWIFALAACTDWEKEQAQAEQRLTAEIAQYEQLEKVRRECQARLQATADKKAKAIKLTFSVSDPARPAVPRLAMHWKYAVGGEKLDFEGLAKETEGGSAALIAADASRAAEELWLLARAYRFCREQKAQEPVTLRRLVEFSPLMRALYGAAPRNYLRELPARLKVTYVGRKKEGGGAEREFRQTIRVLETNGEGLSFRSTTEAGSLSAFNQEGHCSFDSMTGLAPEIMGQRAELRWPFEVDESRWRIAESGPDRLAVAGRENGFAARKFLLRGDGGREIKLWLSPSPGVPLLLLRREGDGLVIELESFAVEEPAKKKTVEKKSPNSHGGRKAGRGRRKHT